MKKSFFSVPRALPLHALTTFLIGVGCVWPLSLSLGLTAPLSLCLTACGAVTLLFALLDCMPRLRALAYPLLLLAIGANMIREALSDEEEEQASAGLDAKTMFLMAVATSIDALAVGITFACVPVELIAASQLMNTVLAVCIIGLTTCMISCAGVKVGNAFGARYKEKAEIAGGAILILIGVKILLEHFGVL